MSTDPTVDLVHEPPAKVIDLAEARARRLLGLPARYAAGPGPREPEPAEVIPLQRHGHGGAGTRDCRPLAVARVSSAPPNDDPEAA